MREEVIFVAVVRAEETMETDKCHSELPKLTARPGTSQSLMKDFAVKTKNFYKSFLDGLYAVADLLLDNRPEPKPPDLDLLAITDPGPQPLPWCGLILTECVTALMSSGTSTKKLSFDFFVKRRRKKTLINMLCNFIPEQL